jgi:Kef-type K+ transport system membrane component KefB
MSSAVFELSLIIGIAAVLALVGKLIRQPTIIAYLITGILVGPLAFNLLQSPEFIEAFARMGVAFLLFIVGLNLDYRVLKDLGKTSSVIGIGGIILTSLIIFLTSLILGFSYTPALYLAVAFSFSSTVVVVKILSDKKELDTLHGRIALGILIVQDFVAAIALMIFPVFVSAGYGLIFWQLGKAILLIAGVFLFSGIIFPSIFKAVAKSQEVLFLFGVGWALMVATLFNFLGFSLEIGALIAGMALASSRYSLEIKGKIKGLRDFFVVLFFVFFGSQLAGPITGTLILQASIFSAAILIGNPIIFMSFMKFFGYKKRTNFYIGISLAQISEFSLILILLGTTIGVLEQELLSLAILTALFTIAVSSYGIHYLRPLFKKCAPLLKAFDGKRKTLGTGNITEDYDVFLFGYNRIGFTLLKVFNKERKKFVVIDYNPKTIDLLSKKGINCIYGDANDGDFLDSLKLEKAKVAISTIPDLDTNQIILKYINKKKAIFIPTSHHIHDTRKLYAYGSDYVIMPHFLGGEFIANMLKKDHFDKKLLHREGIKQLADLNERTLEGHKHPSKYNHGE